VLIGSLFETMINIMNVVTAVLSLVTDSFKIEPTQTSKIEKELAQNLFRIVCDVVNNCEIVHEETLISDKSYKSIEITEENFASSQPLSQGVSSQSSNVTVSTTFTLSDEICIDNNLFDLEYMQQVVKFYDENNVHFSTLKHNFRKVKNKGYINRFRSYIANFGTRIPKLIQIRNHVFENFVNARNLHFPVNDVDLTKWAIIKARKLNFNDFLASTTRVVKFNNDFKIFSRKVTKLISQQQDITQLKTNPEIPQNFLQTVKNYINENHISQANVINTDQSGFNYELHSPRTLSIVNEKSTFLCVNSLHSTTHSYTIQPIVSMAGQLFSKFLICLQEIKGHFGPIVTEDLPKFKNVMITCSKSGKMTRELVVNCNEHIVKPIMKENFVYLVDSWSGHKDNYMYHEIFGDKCKFLQIPPHTTAFLQPLDVFFFDFGNFWLNV
jgi:hypothetical protein